MNSEKLKTLAFSPFVVELTFAVLKEIKLKKIVEEGKYIIDADLVPKVSERVMMASLNRQMNFQNEPIQKSSNVQEERINNKLTEPIKMPKRFVPNPVQRVQYQIPEEENHPIQVPHNQILTPSKDYGKIQVFLEDNSVSSIECPGPGQPIVVVRAGQKQFTRITLSPEEIKELLNEVSDSAHIPLLEGVFRAAVDNFSINAVVSEMIGSRFIIKKQTPYSMLERP